MTELTTCERIGGAAIVTMNRPEALNAISLALEASLVGRMRALDADPDVRAVVLTGTGRAFSVGVDLKELSTEAGMSGRTWLGPESLSGVMRAMRTPLIAAVNGYAVTGGLELALNCDFILASGDARFADTHARVGITPSWGMTQILPRLIGPARAKWMSLTGAYVDAATACDWGLSVETTETGALVDRAVAIAAEIAETDPVSQAKILNLINDGADRPLAEALEMESRVFDAHLATLTPAAIAESRKTVQARGKRVAGGKP